VRSERRAGGVIGTVGPRLEDFPNSLPSDETVHLSYVVIGGVKGGQFVTLWHRGEDWQVSGI